MTKTILSGFETGFKHLLDRSATAQNTFLLKRLANFREMLSGLEKNLRQPDQENDRGTSGEWDAISAYFKQIHDLMDSDQELADHLENEDLLKTWQSELLDLITGDDEKVALAYEEEFWTLKSDDVLSIRMRKLLYFSLHPLYLLNTRRKEPRVEKLPRRRFHKSSFNRTFLVLPAIDYLIREQDYFLQVYSNMLTRLQDASKLFKDEVINADILGQDATYWSSLDKTNPLAAMSNVSQIIDETEKAFAGWNSDVKERYGKFIESLRTEYSKKINIAGTILLPEKKFSAKYIRKQRVDREHKFTLFCQNWLKHFQAVKDEWQKDLELGNLQVVFAMLCQETAYFINQKATNKILPAMETVRDRLEKSRENFNSIKSDEVSALKDTILQQGHELLRELSRKELPKLVEVLHQANLAQTFGGFLARINSSVELLTETHVIIKDYNLKEFPPRTTTVEIPMKDLMLGEILPDELEASRKLESDIQIKLDVITRNISLIDQVVEFNLGAALDLLKEEEISGIKPVEDVHQIIQDGMERATNLLLDIETNFKQVAEDGVTRVQAIALDLQRDIQALGDNEKILELKLRLARARTEEKIRKYRVKAWEIIRTLLPKLITAIREGTSQLLSGYSKMRKISGLAPVAEKAAEDLLAFRLEQITKTRQLPFIYQQLFRLKPLAEARFFYGRKNEMEILKTEFDRFAAGEQRSMAIIGEKGNGKTTLLKFAEKDIFLGYSVHHMVIDRSIIVRDDLVTMLCKGLEIEPVATLDELISHLLAAETRKIFMLEDIHNLFIRTINGFEAIENLLVLVNATKSKVWWIITSGLYGWEYLDHVIHISGYFSRKIILSPLNAGDAREMILARHRMSGFRLNFRISEKISDSRSFKKLTTDEARQAFLEQMFFEKLTEDSGGNIKSSLLYWLNAIDSFDEEEINIAGRFDLDFSFLMQLPAEELYAIAAFIQHEYLTLEQFSRIFNLAEADCGLLLGRMSRKGYLENNGTDFYIPALFYRPAVKVLKLKNVLS